MLKNAKEIRDTIGEYKCVDSEIKDGVEWGIFECERCGHTMEILMVVHMCRPGRFLPCSRCREIPRKKANTLKALQRGLYRVTYASNEVFLK